jgi:hypothetical protein
VDACFTGLPFKQYIGAPICLSSRLYDLPFGRNGRLRSGQSRTECASFSAPRRLLIDLSYLQARLSSLRDHVAFQSLLSEIWHRLQAGRGTKVASSITTGLLNPSATFTKMVFGSMHMVVKPNRLQQKTKQPHPPKSMFFIYCCSSGLH